MRRFLSNYFDLLLRFLTFFSDFFTFNILYASVQGKRSYFWFWNGCEVKIRGHRPTFCSPYQLTPNPDIGNFSLALQQAVAVLRNDSADLAGKLPLAVVGRHRTASEHIGSELKTWTSK